MIAVSLRSCESCDEALAPSARTFVIEYSRPVQAGHPEDRFSLFVCERCYNAAMAERIDG